MALVKSECVQPTSQVEPLSGLLGLFFLRVNNKRTHLARTHLFGPFVIVSILTKTVATHTHTR